MAKRVTTIPATLNRFTSVPMHAGAKRKVAGYARVSTDNEEQQTSYEAQMEYYRDYITGRKDWQFVGMYSDEGISATNTKHRDGFNRMINDALAGKIELIITKSISRFARNTVDSLTTVRKLKEKGVEVYFEKENIWTLDSKGELLITIMSSLAQEESRSISENVTWGCRKRMADGKVSVAYSRFLGYDKGEDGNLVVNKEEAKTVKLIFGEFLAGLSCCAIADKLTGLGIKTPAGKDKWNSHTVKRILQNEKYKGDALLQKYYTADFLTKKQVTNNGEVPQYYVENNHEAIIEPEIFDRVQDIMKERTSRKGYSGVTIFSSKIRCGCCGAWYGSKVWHSNDKYRRVIWQCNSKFKNKTGCQTPHLTEDEIKSAFIRVVNSLITDRNAMIKELRSVRDMLTSTEELEREQKQLAEQMNVDADAVHELIAENARVAQDQEEYNLRYEALVSRFEETKKKYEKVTADITAKEIRRRELERFIRSVEKLPDMVTEFDEALWGSLVDHMTINSREDIVFTMTSGTEISA